MSDKQRTMVNQQRKGLFRWVIGGLLILLLVGIFVLPFFFAGSYMQPYGYRHPFFFFPFGFLIFILFFFFAARWLFCGWGRGDHRGYWHYGDAVEIVRQRYARGEITKEQFDQMIRDVKEQN